MRHHGDFYNRLRKMDEMTLGYRKSMLLLTANHMGLFRLLAQSPANSSEICSALKTSPRGTRLMLDALVGLDIISLNDGIYELAGLGLEFLHPDSEYYMGDIYEHNYNLLTRWMKLEDSIKTGEPLLSDDDQSRTGDSLTAFIMGMQNLCSVQGDGIAEALNIKDVKSILDLGGGPGTLLHAVLKRQPNAKGVVLDRADVVELARQESAKNNLPEIGYISGDIFSANWGGPWDMILLSNIIHSYSEEKNREIIKLCEKNLTHGGQLVIIDFFLDETGTEPSYASLFSLNMLLNTDMGRSYRLSNTEDWVRSSGLNPINYVKVGLNSGILTATKP